MILVLTTPRSASTWYCKHLATEYNLHNFGELFAMDIKEKHKQQLEKLKANPNSVVKVHTVHISNSPVKRFKEKLIRQADDIKILVRKDFNAQVKSFYAAAQVESITGRGFTEEYTDTVHIKLDDNLYNQYKLFIKYQIATLYEITKEYNLFDKVVFSEDVMTAEKKYKRSVQWDREPTIITESYSHLFKEA